MQLPEPAAAWHDEPEPVFLKVVEVSTRPAAMNHLERVDLLIVSLVVSLLSLPLFPPVFGRNHEASHKEDFLEMIWFSFACVCV